MHWGLLVASATPRGVIITIWERPLLLRIQWQFEKVVVRAVIFVTASGSSYWNPPAERFFTRCRKNTQRSFGERERAAFFTLRHYKTCIARGGALLSAAGLHAIKGARFDMFGINTMQAVKFVNHAPMRLQGAWIFECRRLGLLSAPRAERANKYHSMPTFVTLFVWNVFIL